MTKAKNTKQRSRPGSLGEVYDMLDAAFPQYRTRFGGLDVYTLAGNLDMQPQSVYRWFNKETIPADRVKTLVRLSKGRLTEEKLIPFVIK